MDLREVGYDDRDWINLAQDRDKWRAYMRAAVNLRSVNSREVNRFLTKYIHIDPPDESTLRKNYSYLAKCYQETLQKFISFSQNEKNLTVLMKPQILVTNYLPDCQTDCYTNVQRLSDRLAERLSDRLADRLSDRLTERLLDRLADRLSDRLAERLSDRLADRLSDRLAERLSDRLAD
ncbi:hypothetical protein ANN_04631 [Periplaneta americana]|uniref:Uncharacterized protein n=1 Tax=Periplaneta americana TaxID=6978 RepID=A0ABQ8TAM6_PERAM|nr:hypothetical protein ANN_04631 [Periplaneta americana]